MVPFIGRFRFGDEMEDMRLVCAAPVEALEGFRISELLDHPYIYEACFLLDLPHDPVFQALVCVDSSAGQLGQALVVKDEELGAASHEGDDALAQESIQKGAAVAAVNGHAREDGHPATAHETAFDLVLLDEVLPFVLGRACGNRVDEVALVPKIRVSPAGLPDDAELPDELHLKARLLEELALQCVLDGLGLLDPASRHDLGVFGLVDDVEDEELVGPGFRVFPGDVDDDSRTDDQCGWPRIFALWARLAAW